MTKLTIGVKFCGGCRPNFDRGIAYKEITDALSDIAEFKTGDDSDIMLVIRGCGGCEFDFCNKTVFYLSSRSNIPEIIKEIEKLSEEINLKN